MQDDEGIPNSDLEISEEDLMEEIQETMSENKRKTETIIPRQVFVFPLVRRPFFPGMAAPLVIEPGAYFEALKLIAKTENKCMGLFLTKDEECDIYKIKKDDIYSVGVLARILRIIPMESGGAQVILSMEKRITVKKAVKRGGILRAHITVHDEPIYKKTSKELKAYAISIISTIKELLKLNPLFKEELQIFLGHSEFTVPGKLADFAVALTTASRTELQAVLATFDLQGRIDKTLTLLKKELDVSRLQNSITQKIEGSISGAQREFFLKEQLKTIKKELGLEKDEKSQDLAKFEKRLNSRDVPEDAMKVIQEEMDKLSVLEPQSAEYGVCRSYLDWLTIIPWGMYSDETHSLKSATKMLKEDHYGLEDTKERILEFISVGKLTGGVKGSIICLVGPPGVGKTSIGKSIARVLNRKFFRFSVGGMRDEAEIKGHRRTYIGAMPGKIIQALKLTEAMNPVIMIDEVDKMASGVHGDPASALLEVLDPEQNKDFLDHYLDVRCNLSNVLFIVTANVLDTIPEPLIDRMEILRLSGYIQQEKVEIANKFLIPRNRKEMGLKVTEVSFTSSALHQIIHGYARESGVRSLENYIKKILRKIAMKHVRLSESGKKKEIKKEEVTDKTLSKYLGKPKFTTDRFYKKTPVGVCMGLAWTSLGGATLYVEAVMVPAEKTTMMLTGQAGDVMKESSQIAWSYLHSVVNEYAKGTPFFEKSQVHFHIPEGATPKDGPSAGVTMVTALLSLLKGVPVLEDLGMTGELTLTGKVLPIGGLKEKLIAAKRSGVKVLIFPNENRRDFDELPAYLKKGVEVHFVETYNEVYKIAFPQKKKRTKKR